MRTCCSLSAPSYLAVQAYLLKFKTQIVIYLISMIGVTKRSISCWTRRRAARSRSSSLKRKNLSCCAAVVAFPNSSSLYANVLLYRSWLDTRSIILKTRTITTKHTSKFTFFHLDKQLSNCLIGGFRFPFFACDVLASNAMILQALLEGGWSQDKEEEPEGSDVPSTMESEHTMVNSILKGSDKSEQQMVQSALNS